MHSSPECEGYTENQIDDLESAEQLADNESGSDGADSVESSGNNSGEGDKARASTAAE